MNTCKTVFGIVPWILILSTQIDKDKQVEMADKKYKSLQTKTSDKKSLHN